MGEQMNTAVHSVDLADGGSLNLILFVDGAYRMLYEKGGVSVDVPLAWLDVMAARSMFGDAVLARHGEATQ